MRSGVYEWNELHKWKPRDERADRLSGQLTISVINPACMVVFAVALVAILIKRGRERQEDEE